MPNRFFLRRETLEVTCPVRVIEGQLVFYKNTPHWVVSYDGTVARIQEVTAGEWCDILKHPLDAPSALLVVGE